MILDSALARLLQLLIVVSRHVAHRRSYRIVVFIPLDSFVSGHAGGCSGFVSRSLFFILFFGELGARRSELVSHPARHFGLWVLFTKK